MQIIYLYPPRAQQQVRGRRRGQKNDSLHLQRRALLRRLGLCCSANRPAYPIDCVARALLDARI